MVTNRNISTAITLFDECDIALELDKIAHKAQNSGGGCE